MKTKNLLFAMALPVVFTACTSDEIMESSVIAQRGTLDNIAIAVDNGAETRFAWENNKWAFQEGDKFGAGITDPTLGTVADTYISNYVYEKQANGMYTTTSVMTEGIYQFYSYPQFENKDSRKLIQFELGEQICDLTDPAKVINDTQLFFSPLYQLASGEENSNLKVAMYPYYGVAAFNLKNTSGKTITLSHIVLNSGSSENFTVKGEISPVALKNAKYIYSRDKEGNFVLPKDVKIDDAKTSLFWTSNFAKVGASESDVLVLGLENGKLANGESVVAYMNVPVGSYTDLTASVVFVNEAGEAKEFELNNTKVVGINTQAFKHGVTKAVFGLTTDKQMKAYSITKKDVETAVTAGHYISSKADFLALMNQNFGALEIFNMGNWSIDKEVADAIALYSGASIKFKNPAEIKTTEALELPAKVNFAAGLVVAEGEATLNASTVAESIEVKEGAALTMNGGTYSANINNAGTLTIIGITGGTHITSTGVLNNVESKINAQIAIKGGSLILNKKAANTNGTEYAIIPSVSDVNKDNLVNVEIAKGVTVTNVDALKAIQFVTITNNGTINALADNNGTVVNNGVITTVTDNHATIMNAGEITSLTANNGYIEMTTREAKMAGSAQANKALINNTQGGWINTVTSIQNAYIYAVGNSQPAFTCDLLVVNGATISSNKEIKANVLMLGNAAVTGEVKSASTWTVGLKDLTTDAKMKEVVERVTGVDLTTESKKSANLKALNAAAKLTFYETATLDGVSNSYTTLNIYGKVWNRNTTTDAIKVATASENIDTNWEGTAASKK